MSYGKCPVWATAFGTFITSFFFLNATAGIQSTSIYWAHAYPDLQQSTQKNRPNRLSSVELYAMSKEVEFKGIIKSLSLTRVPANKQEQLSTETCRIQQLKKSEYINICFCWQHIQPVPITLRKTYTEFHLASPQSHNAMAKY